MYVTGKEYDLLVAELRAELGARTDGSGKNLIARCPFCGKEGKLGVYIGKETARKKPFMAHCFSCGRSTTTLGKLLESLGRMDLLPTETVASDEPLPNVLFPLVDLEEEVDDELGIVSLPESCGAPLPILICKAGDLSTTITTAFRWALLAG